MSTTDVRGYFSDSDKVGEKGYFEQAIPGSPVGPASTRVYVPIGFVLADGTLTDRWPVEEGPSIRNEQIYIRFPGALPHNAEVEWFRYLKDGTVDGTARETLPLPVLPKRDCAWSPMNITWDHPEAVAGPGPKTVVAIGIGLWHDSVDDVVLTTRVAKDYSPAAFAAGRNYPPARKPGEE